MTAPPSSSINPKTSSSSSMEESPMIPVPQALRTVLQQTATCILQNQQRKSSSTNSEYIPLSSPSLAIGRISSTTIYAPKNGYPPYHASVMDGYAIHVSDKFDSTNNHDNSTIKRFQIVDRVHAGRHNPNSKEEEENDDNDASASAPSLKEAMKMLQNSNLPKAIYVTTGAIIPSYPTYNAVIPVEQVDEYISNQVIAVNLDVLKHDIKPNQWIRNIACDIQGGSLILNKGDKIDPVHIGLCLQCGMTSVQVEKMVTVGVLSTGNEILSVQDMMGQEFSNQNDNVPLGMIPDANGPVLSSLLSTYRNCNIINYGIVNDDDIPTLAGTLLKACQECDVVVTSGGVSMGEKDVMEYVLREKLNCDIHFGRLHMKPGKPTTFATWKGQSIEGEKGGDVVDKKCLIFAMPGNPVSAYVCTELLVRPCLDMLHSTVANIGTAVQKGKKKDNNILTMVQNANVHAEVYATLTKGVRLDVERPEYLRVMLSTTIVHHENYNHRHNGNPSFSSSMMPSMQIQATPTGVQRSSRLMSMCHADGLMLMPQGIPNGKVFAEVGESYPVLLLQRPAGGGGEFLKSIKLKDSLHYQNSSLAVGILEIVGSSDGGDTYHENVIVARDNNGSDNIDKQEEGNDDTNMDVNNKSSNIKTRIQNIMNDKSIIFLQNEQITSDESVTDTIRTTMSNCLDILFVVCSKTSFPTNLRISEEIRRCITKDAHSLSLQARKSAAYDYPLAALFDSVAGYCELDGKSCMILSVPNGGMESALESVDVLLRRGISIASGKKVV